MTSEVVVMNRIGIALASDSAATVRIDGRSKIYHADKLFMLSNCHPVGIMIYNNSSLLGVPWEIIIKLFRQHIGNRERDYLANYANEFIDYINSCRNLFPEDIQHRYFSMLVNTMFNRLNLEIRKELLKKVLSSSETGTSLQKEAIEEVQ
jgi:hypothetical protein